MRRGLYSEIPPEVELVSTEEHEENFKTVLNHTVVATPVSKQEVVKQFKEISAKLETIENLLLTLIEKER